jgi:hypothetical protein
LAASAQRQHGFDVNFDFSFDDQISNCRQLLGVRLLANEESADSGGGGFVGRRLLHQRR